MTYITNKLIICGDVHGKYDQYYNIVKNYEFSIQVGDFGFGGSWTSLYYSDLSPNNHKICSGNHDDMDAAKSSAFWLGDFGVHRLGDFCFFFIRGGLSIDRTYRVGEWLSSNRNPGYKSYWSNEELNFVEMNAALTAYKNAKPEHVISHSLPVSFRNQLLESHKNPVSLQKFGFDLGFEENTSLLLEECFKAHKPKLWVGGHYHQNFHAKIDGCDFYCLNELEVLKI